jgi:hypothetical protein
MIDQRRFGHHLPRDLNDPELATPAQSADTQIEFEIQAGPQKIFP